MNPRVLVLACFGLVSCSAPPSVPAPECNVQVDGCEGCGDIGCPCFSDESCDQGSCSENQTCVRIEQGMVYVPAGRFWMGCREGVDTDEITGPCPEDELPYRQVTLSSFWIDRTEVRKGDYRLCMEAGVCSEPSAWDEEHWEGIPQDGQPVPGSDDFPTAGLSWTQAKTYCEWAGKRLPTRRSGRRAREGPTGASILGAMTSRAANMATMGPTMMNVIIMRSFTR